MHKALGSILSIENKPIDIHPYTYLYLSTCIMKFWKYNCMLDSPPINLCCFLLGSVFYIVHWTGTHTDGDPALHLT
jgi:starvation-inducible outer membrane lipoprotein